MKKTTKIFIIALITIVILIVFYKCKTTKAEGYDFPDWLDDLDATQLPTFTLSPVNPVTTPQPTVDPTVSAIEDLNIRPDSFKFLQSSFQYVVISDTPSMRYHAANNGSDTVISYPPHNNVPTINIAKNDSLYKGRYYPYSTHTNYDRSFDGRDGGYILTIEEVPNNLYPQTYCDMLHIAINFDSNLTLYSDILPTDLIDLFNNLGLGNDNVKDIPCSVSVKFFADALKTQYYACSQFYNCTWADLFLGTTFSLDLDLNPNDPVYCIQYQIIINPYGSSGDRYLDLTRLYEENGTTNRTYPRYIWQRDIQDKFYFNRKFQISQSEREQANLITRIGNTFSNLFEWAFVPTEDQMNSLISGYTADLDSEAAQFALGLRTRLYNLVTDSETTLPSITIPEFSLDIDGETYTIWNETTLDFNYIVSHGGDSYDTFALIQDIVSFLHMFSAILLTVAFANSLLSTIYAMYEVHISKGVQK